jgi:hypothetical protein
MVVKVFSTSFQPKVIEDEATEDVEQLPRVCEFIGVVREETGRIIFEFHGGFPKKHEGLGGCEVTVNFPFIPDAFESLPRILSHWTIK